MSLQSPLLAQPLGFGEPQTVQPVWAQPHRHQTKIRMAAAVLLMSAVCCQVFPGGLWICGISLLPAISSREMGRGEWQTLAHPAHLGGSASHPALSKHHAGRTTRLCPDLLSRSISRQRITSKALQTKDGVGSTPGPCLDKMTSEGGLECRVMWMNCNIIHAVICSSSLVLGPTN